MSGIGDTRLTNKEPLNLKLSQSGVGYTVIQVKPADNILILDRDHDYIIL